MIYLKILINTHKLHIGLDGLTENNILNITLQNMNLGYKTSASTKKELYDYYKSLSKEEQLNNELLYEQWDSEINWHLI